MIPLILFIVLVIVVLVLTEVHERRKQKDSTTKENLPQKAVRPEGCCGTHLVCEKENILQTNAKPEYYDDEELDALADLDPTSYTEAQYQAIRQVFDTLSEVDVPGWCRSLQLRHIELPDDIREEALLIVREQRAKS